MATVALLGAAAALSGCSAQDAGSSDGTVAMTLWQNSTTGPGQESVWDYPRPPRVDPSTELVEVHLGGEVVARSTASLRPRDQPPADVLPARGRVRPGRAATDERSHLVRVEGPRVVRRPGHGRRRAKPQH